MSKVKIVHPYGPKNKIVLDCSGDDGRTQQQFARECNINNIVEQFLGGKDITHINPNEPVFTEVPQIDFTQAALALSAASQRMDQLPSKLREKFGNDPAQLLNYIQDRENNLDEGRELGIYAPEEAEPEPQKVEVVNPPTQETAAQTPAE